MTRRPDEADLYRDSLADLYPPRYVHRPCHPSQVGRAAQFYRDALANQAPVACGKQLDELEVA
jgi:hypothetical protein